MKRHARLQDLSREHYVALKLALDAKRSAAGDGAAIAAAAGRCRTAFAEQLAPHFTVEENELLPLLAAAGLGDLVERTESEHGELRRLAAALETPDAALLGAFAASLEAHVRFEERELFTALQDHCL